VLLLLFEVLYLSRRLLKFQKSVGWCLCVCVFVCVCVRCRVSGGCVVCVALMFNVFRLSCACRI